MLSIPDLDLSDPAWAIPIDQDLVAVQRLLRKLNYTPVAIAEALGHLAEHRTAECCAAIEDEDRAAVEQLLPFDSLGWAQPWVDFYRYLVTEGDGDA